MAMEPQVFQEFSKMHLSSTVNLFNYVNIVQPCILNN